MKMTRMTKTTKILNNVAPPKLQLWEGFVTPITITEKGLGLDAYETQGNL